MFYLSENLVLNRQLSAFKSATNHTQTVAINMTEPEKLWEK